MAVFVSVTPSISYHETPVFLIRMPNADGGFFYFRTVALDKYVAPDDGSENTAQTLFDSRVEEFSVDAVDISSVDKGVVVILAQSERPPTG